MKKHPVLHFYSKVGAPELVFSIFLILLFFVPFIFKLEGSFIQPLLYSLYALALDYLVISWNAKFKKAITFVIFLSILFRWLHFFNVSIPNNVDFSFELFIYITSFYFVSKSIFVAEKVDFNSLLAAISGYLLLGMALGLIVFTIETIYPTHFSFSTNFTIFDSYYYSFITMSTLGYGDIVPTSRGGKGLAILITLIGQFYMVIVVGLIIGQLLASKKSDK